MATPSLHVGCLWARNLVMYGFLKDLPSILPGRGCSGCGSLCQSLGEGDREERCIRENAMVRWYWITPETAPTWKCDLIVEGSLIQKEIIIDVVLLCSIRSNERWCLILQGALQNAIAACACVSSAMKQKVCCLLEQYGLPVLPIRHGLGQHSAKQVSIFSHFWCGVFWIVVIEDLLLWYNFPG